MLQKIRDRIQGWFAGVIIGLIAVGFVFWGLEYYISRSQGEGATIAKVNGEKVTSKAFSQAYQELKRRQQQASDGQPLSPEMLAELKQYTLNNIVSRLVLIQSARDAGFNVSPRVVKQMIISTPEFQVDGRFSKARFEQMVIATFGTLNRFYTMVQADAMTNQVMGGIQQSAFALPQEVKDAYSLLKQKREIGYFTLPVSRFKGKVKVSEQEIKAFYTQNKERFVTPLKVKVSYIAILPDTLRKKVSVTDAEVKQYYSRNQQNFTIPKRWQVEMVSVPLPKGATQEQIKAAQQKADALAEKLKSGKVQFADLLKKKNADYKSMTQWYTQDDLSGVFAAIIPSMKLQQLSSPFRMEKGIAIVRVAKVEQEHVRPFVKVQPTIKKQIMQQKVSQALNKLSDELSNLTYTNPTTLSEAAKEMNVKVMTSPFITRQGAKSGLLADKKVLTTVFSDDVLKQGNNSYPISLKGGGVVVVRIASKQESATIPFDKVKEKIKAELVTGKTQREAGLVAYQIQTALQDGKPEQAIAKQYNVKWTYDPSVGVSDKKLPKEILRAAFKLAPTLKGKTKAVDTVLIKNNQYVIIQLLGITLADFAKANELEKAALTAEMTKFWAQMDYRLYAKSLTKNAKIKINRKALANI